MMIVNHLRLFRLGSYTEKDKWGNHKQEIEDMINNKVQLRTRK